jgi:anti-sigma factor RsiW
VLRLSAYLEEDLDQQARRRLEAHLGACPVCRRVRTTLERTVQLIRSSRDLLWPESACRRRVPPK